MHRSQRYMSYSCMIIRPGEWDGKASTRGRNLSSELRLVDSADPLVPATSQLRKNRRPAIHVLSTPLDPSLTLERVMNSIRNGLGMQETEIARGCVPKLL